MGNSKYRVLRTVSAGAEAAVVTLKVGEVDGKLFLPRAFKAAYDSAPRVDKLEHPMMISTSELVIKSQTPWSKTDPITQEVKSGLNTTFMFKDPKDLKIGFVRPVDTASGASLLSPAELLA